MKPISNWRTGSMIFIAMLCIYLTYPSVRYFLALRDAKPTDPEALTKHEDRLEELRTAAIPLGLDLRGGVDVSLMIDEKAALKSAVESLAATLKTEFADKKVSASVAPSESGTQLLVKALDAADARNISNILANYQERISGDYSQERLATTNEVALDLDNQLIQMELEGNIEGALKIIRNRIDQFGVAQPSISRQGENRIRIQVPGLKDPEKLIDNITTLAQMEFRLAHEGYGSMQDPAAGLLDPQGNLLPGAIVPLGYELVPFKFGNVDKATQKVVYREGKMLVERLVQLKGSNLRDTGVIQNPMDIANPIVVSLRFDAEGTEAFGKMTSQSADQVSKGQPARQMAVLLDGVVITSPEMKVPITNGSAIIQGGFSYDEARDLATLLKGGSLPAPLTIETKNTVGATLGTESILGGVKALLWGTIIVLVFMVVYYGMAGMIANVALIMNVLIVFTIMSLSKATLTLSGIGGILLTVGMAVDANVLIYERIREEVNSGRPLKQAIAVGFERAYYVILDSNITTLIAALILLQFTEGSVFGFALTMCFGLIANLYTGLAVTYTLCALWFQWKNSLSLGTLSIFKNTMFDFIKLRYISLSGSAIAIVLGIVMIFATGGLRFGVDFAGGLLAEVQFTKVTNESELRDVIRAAGFEGERVQSRSGDNAYLIRVKDTEDHEGGDLAGEAILRKALTEKYGEDGYAVERFSTFGPETGQEFQNMALSVMLIASIAILLYLWFRFEWIFGLAAVIALLHDLLIAAIYTQLWGVEISLDVVAALMVLLGFSVNDTIVIFDRIRENTQLGKGKTFTEVCNLAVNQSLDRTIITSGTVVLTILAMLIFGGDGLAPFSKTLLIGCLAGTYSTEFIATPIVYEYNRRKQNKLMTALAEKKAIGPEEAKAPQLSAPAGTASVPTRRTV